MLERDRDVPESDRGRTDPILEGHRDARSATSGPASSTTTPSTATTLKTSRAGNRPYVVPPGNEEKTEFSITIHAETKGFRIKTENYFTVGFDCVNSVEG